MAKRAQMTHERIGAILAPINDPEVCIRLAVRLLAGDGWANIRDVITVLHGTTASRHAHRDINALVKAGEIERRNILIRLRAKRPTSCGTPRMPSQTDAPKIAWR